MLTAMAGMYTDVDFIRAPIVNPDDEIALQPNRVFNLSLEIASEFVDDVELGAMVGPDETFSASNLTVLDDDSERYTICLIMTVVIPDNRVTQHKHFVITT